MFSKCLGGCLVRVWVIVWLVCGWLFSEGMGGYLVSISGCLVSVQVIVW